MPSLINQAVENNTDDFKILKKYYGERFAKLCRSLFPTILEQKGVLANLILSKFEPSKFLYEDLISNYATDRFKNFIYSFYIKENNSHVDVSETPEQLFDKAGYTLYKCETNEDVHKFKKYFKPNEKLCTFHDPNRIITHKIFFAVKKNVDEIKRENFNKPRRQDEYGTSVISLQFTKGKRSTLSIKNRYNHTVDNPDATFSNDLENIYPGLTDSFKKYYGINLVAGKHNFELPNYVMAKDGKYYRYNYEIDNIYYCPNNIVISHDEVKYYDSRRYDLIDYFVIDKQEKNIFNANGYVYDKFDTLFKDSWGTSKIIKIEISKNGEEKTFKFILQDNKVINITVNKYNQIVKFSSTDIIALPYGFLRENKVLRELNTPNVIQIDRFALNKNESIKIFNLPNVERIEDIVMNHNANVEEIICPSLVYLGSDSFTNIPKVKNLVFLNLEYIGDDSLKYANGLEKFIAPNLKTLNRYCLQYAQNLTTIDVKSLEVMQARSLQYAEKLAEFIAPNLKRMESFCLSECNLLKVLNASKLEKIGSYCFNNSGSLIELRLPKITSIEDNCFTYCESLQRVYALRLKNLGRYCFTYTPALIKFKATKLESSSVLDISKRNKTNERNL